LDSDPQAAADPDYAAGRRAIEARNWNAAIKSFSSAALRAPDNADIQNYLGYAHRKAGQLDSAFRHYKRALELNPSTAALRVHRRGVPHGGGTSPMRESISKNSGKSACCRARNSTIWKRLSRNIAARLAQDRVSVLASG